MTDYTNWYNFCRRFQSRGYISYICKNRFRNPIFIQALTNITEQDLFEAPYFEEEQSLYAQLKDCVFVA